MQTFLPFADFQQSAVILDNERLRCQKKECLQILKALTIPRYGWQHHPAVKMWKGYEYVLYHHYMAAIVSECYSRGFKDTCYEKARLVLLNSPQVYEQSLDNPWWLGYEPLHSSHRSILLAKRPKHYTQFGWTEKPAITKFNKYPYVWPTKLPAGVIDQLKWNEPSLDSLSVSPAPSNQCNELKVT